MHRALVTVVTTFALATTATAQCPPQGITLNASGGRLGDAWRVDVHGSPSVAGFCGLDLSPGPTPTPIGTVCLGLGPALQVLPFVADAAGHAVFGGLMPPNPAFALPGAQAALAVAPSAGYGHGCVALGSNVAFPFGTDPFAPSATALLGISSSQFRIVSD